VSSRRPAPTRERSLAPSLDDREVADAVIGMMASRTHAEVASRLVRRFGPDRAWPAEMVRAFTLARGANGLRGLPGERGVIERQPVLRAFVDARIGRMSIEALVAAARERFGAHALSHSGLHRYIQRERDRVLADRTRPR